MLRLGVDTVMQYFIKKIKNKKSFPWEVKGRICTLKTAVLSLQADVHLGNWGLVTGDKENFLGWKELPNSGKLK